jgi:hypothetical protein
MAKFSGGDSIGYIRIVAELKRQLANLEKGGKEQLENKTVSRSSIYGSTLLNGALRPRTRQWTNVIPGSLPTEECITRARMRREQMHFMEVLSGRERRLVSLFGELVSTLELTRIGSINNYVAKRDSNDDA